MTIARRRTPKAPATPAARAFSLIEMLFVIAIIGLIAALILPRLGGAFGKSQVQTTKAQLASLTSAVETYRMNVGRYPTKDEGLAALLKKPDGAEGWEGPYLEKKVVPRDGWKREFIYTPDDEWKFIIKSLGADGKEGGEGENADLDNRS